MTRRFLCLEAGRVFLSCFWFFLLACSAPQVPSAEAIGLNAEYFVDSNWGAVCPSKGVRPGSFSARWSGYTHLYIRRNTPFISAEGKAVLYINEQLIAKDNKSGKVRLQAGSKASIRVEYAKANNKASLKLEWQSPSQPRQVVPPDASTPPVSP